MVETHRVGEGEKDLIDFYPGPTENGVTENLGYATKSGAEQCGLERLVENLQTVLPTLSSILLPQTSEQKEGQANIGVHMDTASEDVACTYSPGETSEGFLTPGSASVTSSEPNLHRSESPAYVIDGMPIKADANAWPSARASRSPERSFVKWREPCTSPEGPGGEAGQDSDSGDPNHLFCMPQDPPSHAEITSQGQQMETELNENQQSMKGRTLRVASKRTCKFLSFRGREQRTDGTSRMLGRRPRACKTRTLNSQKCPDCCMTFPNILSLEYHMLHHTYSYNLKMPSVVSKGKDNPYYTYSNHL